MSIENRIFVKYENPIKFHSIVIYKEKEMRNNNLKELFSFKN